MKVSVDDEVGRALLLRVGAVYDPDTAMWSAQPPAAPLRERFGCVPNPYSSHRLMPSERGNVSSISDLMLSALR